MNSKVALVIFIVIASTLFPLAGYFLDWKHHKKKYKKENH